MPNTDAEPWFATHRFAEADEIAAALRGTQAEYVPLQSGRYDSSLTLIGFGSTTVQSAHDRAHVTRGRIDGSSAGILICVRHAGEALLNGMPIRTDDGIVLEPGAELHALCRSEIDWASITLPAAEAARLVELAALPAPGRAGGGSLRLPPRVVAPIRQGVAAATAFIRTIPPGAAMPETARAIAASLRELTLAAFGRAEMHAAVPRATRSAIRMLDAAEDIMRAAPSRALYTDDLCAALGVSPRTLHKAFVTAAGMSPQAYLRRRRLVQVHVALKSGAPDATLVKSAALAHGFWHLGHFARAYREQFGQTPSETLAQARAGAYRPQPMS